MFTFFFGAFLKPSSCFYLNNFLTKEVVRRRFSKAAASVYPPLPLLKVSNVCDCEVLTGVRKGERVLIPRIFFAPDDTHLLFKLKRVQFPLRLAYVLTINKSQGQTFEEVGIYLEKACFDHGQLYVAFSRARSFRSVKVKVANTFQQGYVKGKCFTKNVVYKQVL